MYNNPMCPYYERGCKVDSEHACCHALSYDECGIYRRQSMVDALVQAREIEENRDLLIQKMSEDITRRLTEG